MVEGVYIYRGDRLTDPDLRGRRCVAVRRADGKCIVGRSAMLVRFDGERVHRVVQRRQLRKGVCAFCGGERYLMDSGSVECAWCGATDALQLDHIIPASDNGSDGDANYQVLCASCNCAKDGRGPDRYDG